jgi:hypothetical protein
MTRFLIWVAGRKEETADYVSARCATDAKQDYAVKHSVGVDVLDWNYDANPLPVRLY